jgi:hypothetical protein
VNCVVPSSLRAPVERYGKTVVTTHEGWLDITLPDGTTFQALPQDNDEYRAMAERLGYGTDTLAMCRDHDPLHAAMAQFLGLSVSPALAGGANGDPINELTGAEEDMVLSIQRFMRMAMAAGLIKDNR